MAVGRSPGRGVRGSVRNSIVTLYCHRLARDLERTSPRPEMEGSGHDDPSLAGLSLPLLAIPSGFRIRPLTPARKSCDENAS